MADQAQATDMEAAQKQLAQEQQLTEKSKQEYAERTKGKPTPTQQENDLAACGAHFHEHEPDGSDPDPYATKEMEAKKPTGGYQTRQVTSSRHAQAHTPHSSSS
jgi:hypothetical protein